MSLLELFQPQFLWVFAPSYKGSSKVQIYGNCSVQVFNEEEYLNQSDIVIINGNGKLHLFQDMTKRKDQIWIMELLESPPHTKNLTILDDKVKIEFFNFIEHLTLD